MAAPPRKPTVEFAAPSGAWNEALMTTGSGSDQPPLPGALVTEAGAEMMLALAQL